VYEDSKIYAFKDINPQAPVHVVIIPKNKDGLTGISQVFHILLRLRISMWIFWAI